MPRYDAASDADHYDTLIADAVAADALLLRRCRHAAFDAAAVLICQRHCFVIYLRAATCLLFYCDAIVAAAAAFACCRAAMRIILCLL